MVKIFSSGFITELYKVILPDSFIIEEIVSVIGKACDLSELYPNTLLGQQLDVIALYADGDGVFKVLQSAVFLVADGSSTANAVVNASDEDLADELFAHAPFLSDADEQHGFRILPILQPASSGQQRQFGAVRMVLQGVAVDLSETLPVAKLPLGAGAFEQVFVVGDGMGGSGAVLAIT